MSGEIPTNPDDLLSDEEFTSKYGSSTFGREPVPGQKTEDLDPVSQRLLRISSENKKKELDTLARNNFDEQGKYIPRKEGKTEELPPQQLDKNLDGQYVDPKTSEPVRKGSLEYQELARRNELPRNQ